MKKATLGIIGGSGIYNIENLEILDEFWPETPFGKPSDPIRIGTFGNGLNIAFLSRHGRGHRLMPSEVPSRANIYALKECGVEGILSLSAVGSLQEAIAPTHLLVPDQVIDRTKNRPSTFFGDGIVGHISFAEPFCSDLRDVLIETVKETDAIYHESGTYVCMEGPAFSTRAESNLYRQWGASVIGMTALPEAKLAREAEICYATLALVTDYDCWREEEEAVNVDMVVATMKKNNETAKKIVRAITDKYPAAGKDCSCRTAAQYAVMTADEHFPETTKAKLKLFYQKYWS